MPNSEEVALNTYTIYRNEVMEALSSAVKNVKINMLYLYNEITITYTFTAT